MHKNTNSHTTPPKVKSKIRIIHVFAPQIIKTDAANFRELVQRLTGKPADDEEKKCAKKSEQEHMNSSSNNNNIFQSDKKMEVAEMQARFHAGFREKINGEDEIWRDADTGGGFLGGFSEFNDHQFPFMEGTSQNIDVFDESQVIA